MKFHLSLNTDRFEETVAFYRAFLGTDPVKLKPGYAKFDLDDPALNLTLNQTGSAKAPVSQTDKSQTAERQTAETPTNPTPGPLNHLGFQVDSTERVNAAARRLEEAGLATRSEDNTDCCSALQDKVWVQDPNGNAWEIFVVKVADTQPEASLPATAASCC